MKKIMMLGAGSCQINGIKKISELGYISVVSDNKLDSIGKKIADIAVLADTFSYDETYKKATENNIDGILTTGTDQPILTVSKVAKKLNLECFLSEEIAKNVTNKRNMKTIFKSNNIKTVNFKLIKKDFKDEELSQLKGPYVIKPLDSQGQRGIYKLESIEEIRDYFEKVIVFSREDEILVEEYYKNKEITVTGWVDKGKVKILTVTDRVTFEDDNNIGVCISHEYPSIHLKQYREEIFHITKKICIAFKIKEGPIYFQYLVGNKGVLVNEIACRIGGAYEDISVLYLTNVDILKMNIEGSINKNYDKKNLETYEYSEEKCLSTQLFFCKPGYIKYMSKKKDLLKNKNIIDLGFNYKVGDTISEIENASQRAGYIIIKGKNESDIKKNISDIFNEVQILDDNNNNLIIKGKRFYR